MRFKFYTLLILNIILLTASTSLCKEAEILWKFKTNDFIATTPAIDANGNIYFLSNDSYIYALRPDGTLKWKWKYYPWERYEPEYPIPQNSSPTIDKNGVIYFGINEGYFYALNPNGTLRWKFDTDDHMINNSPAIGRDGTIYFGSDSNFLYALDSNGTVKWKYKTYRMICSSPVISKDGIIYFGSESGYFIALNSDGTLKWKFKTNGAIWNSSAISADGNTYFGSDDHNLYALNDNGTLKWKFKTNEAILSSPAISKDGTIYFGSNDNYFYALNPDGSLKFKLQTKNIIRSSPAVSEDGTVYFGSNDEYFYALNQNGTLKWKYWLGIKNNSPTIGKNGTIYVGSYDNCFYAFKGSSPLANSPWPKFQNNLQNTSYSIHKKIESKQKKISQNIDIIKTFLYNRQIDYYKTRIGGNIYEVAYIEIDDLQGVVVFDEHKNIVVNRSIIEKAFDVGNICGFGSHFYDNENYRFTNLIDNKVTPIKENFQTVAYQIIPIAEALGIYAFDIGPKILAEAVKIALTGGASTTATASKSLGQTALQEIAKLSKDVSKEVLNQALKDMKINPRPFIVAGLVDILNNSITKLKEIERRALEMKELDVLDYNAVMELEATYWEAVSSGYAAIAGYYTSMGDIASNISMALANFSFQMADADFLSQFIGLLDKSKSSIEAMTKFGEVYDHWLKSRESEELMVLELEKINECLNLAYKIKSKQNITSTTSEKFQLLAWRLIPQGSEDYCLNVNLEKMRNESKLKKFSEWLYDKADNNGLFKKISLQTNNLSFSANTSSHSYILIFEGNYKKATIEELLIQEGWRKDIKSKNIVWVGKMFGPQSYIILLDNAIVCFDQQKLNYVLENINRKELIQRVCKFWRYKESSIINFFSSTYSYREDIYFLPDEIMKQLKFITVNIRDISENQKLNINVLLGFENGSIAKQKLNFLQSLVNSDGDKTHSTVPIYQVRMNVQGNNIIINGLIDGDDIPTAI